MKRFEFSKSKTSSFRLGIRSSNQDDDYGLLNISIWKWNLYIKIPSIIRPHKEKTKAYWDEATIKRLGRDWYWNITPREYSISIFEGFVNIYYGLASDDSITQQQFGYFIPWLQYRMVRHSLYDQKGNEVYKHNGGRYCAFNDNVKLVSKVAFTIKDFDGEEIEAITHIEEREWYRGTSWCKWLSLFMKSTIRRELAITFDRETGHKKGSWKGGIIGSGIELFPEELHAEGFSRYCIKHNMCITDMRFAK